MPEVPGTMQDNIAYLERQSRASRNAPAVSPSPRYPEHSFPSSTSSAPYAASYAQPWDYSPYGAGLPEQSRRSRGEFSLTSAFPILRGLPPNVPPTDEDREANLERARSAVLSSNDPEMQLAWAQDALAYVEVALQNEGRLALIRPPRPQSPPVERQLRMDAMNIVNFLADQHHPRAEFIKGTWLEFGKFGYPVDRKGAFLCYSRSSERGYPRAEYRVGMQFENANEPEKAIKYYEKGVLLGDSASYYVWCPAYLYNSMTGRY